MTLLVRKVKELREVLKGKEVGFVPTMGYLHEGHLALIRRAREENPFVVVSIYVNPTQFGKGEDFERYPRDLERDLKICKKEGVDVVFAPTDEEVYPFGYLTEVHVKGISEVLEGKFRPNHFKGVATVVLKLLNIVRPRRAYFGEKDYQQLKLVEKMVRDLFLDVEIVAVKTVRDKDGLALSSRNTYLSEEERKSALSLYKSLLLAKELIEKGERDAKKIKEKMREFILSFEKVKKIDYVEITDKELNPKDFVEEGDRILLAVWVGNTRLIDNWEVGEPL